jgi:hypothetical protein
MKYSFCLGFALPHSFVCFSSLFLFHVIVVLFSNFYSYMNVMLCMNSVKFVHDNDNLQENLYDPVSFTDTSLNTASGKRDHGVQKFFNNVQKFISEAGN